MYRIPKFNQQKTYQIYQNLLYIWTPDPGMKNTHTKKTPTHLHLLLGLATFEFQHPAMSELAIDFLLVTSILSSFIIYHRNLEKRW